MVCAAAVLAASWVVVAIERGVPDWEAQVFEWANQWPAALWPVVWGPMQLGSLGGAVAVSAATLAVTRRRRLALALLTAGGATWLSAKLVKELVSRGRPAVFLEELHLRDEASGFGYVSGHAAVSFSLATVLAPSLPRAWRPVAFGAAALVSWSRVYAGAHLPLDVVGGAGLGILLGTVTRWAFGLGGAGLSATAPEGGVR